MSGKKGNGAQDVKVERAAEVVAEFKPDGMGGGTLELSYRGPLAKLNPLWVRVGERRHGEDWLQVRDVQMKKANNLATARIHIADGEGEPLEGASFAFFAVRDGQDPVWDNAGRPFGCYKLDAKTQRVHPG